VKPIWVRTHEAIQSNVSLQLFKAHPEASVVTGIDAANDAVKEVIRKDIQERIAMLKDRAKESYKLETRNGLNGIAVYLEAMLASWEKL
jgi:predicted secreted Zn-dependent protease